MPDPNFKELIQKPATKRVPDPDFKAIVGPDRSGTQLPVAALPDSAKLEPRDVARDHTKAVLNEFGYDRATIDSLTVPPGSQPDLILTGRPPFVPMPETDRVPLNEAMKITAQVQAEGQSPDGAERQNLFDAISEITRIAPGVPLAGLAEGRSWLNKLYDAAADRTTDLLGTTLMDLSLGIGLLDFMNYTNKKLRIDGFKLGGWQIVPPGARIPLGKTYLEMPGVADDAERAEMELRMLPKITLTRYGDRFSFETPQEFGTSSFAALYLIDQRLTGRYEKIVGGIAKNIGKMTRSETIQEAGQETIERGRERVNFTNAAIPPYVASLGEYPFWQDIEEANMDPEELNWRYKWIADHGTTGQAAALTMSFGTAITEVIGDANMVMGAMPGKLMSVGRTVLRNKYPLEYAQGLADVAKRSGRVEDALLAAAASKQNLSKAQRAASETLLQTGEHAEIDNTKRLIVTRRAHAVDREHLGRFEPPGPHEHILYRTAKRHPDSVPDPKPSAYRPPTAEFREAHEGAYDKALTRFNQLFDEAGGGLEADTPLPPPNLPSGSHVVTTANGRRLSLYKHPTKQGYVVEMTTAAGKRMKKESTEFFPFTRVVPFKQAKRTAFLEPGLRNLPTGKRSSFEFLQRWQEGTPTTNKPQGLYLSPANLESPHVAEIGEARVQTLYKNTATKTLDVTDVGPLPIRKGATDSGTTVKALKKLNPSLFAELKNLTFLKLFERAKQMYPDVNWSEFIGEDSQMILEAIGGKVAREKGYDSVTSLHPDRWAEEFDEFVALSPDAITPVSAEQYKAAQALQAGAPGPAGITDLERFADEATLAPKAPVDTAYELAKMQKRALLRDYDCALEWDVDSNVFKHRQLFGPDGAEEAGDALNHLARTGGEGIDDVAVHEVFPEYNTSSPATGISHTNWQQIDAVNELTRAERELAKAPQTEGLKIGQYSVRVLARQRGVARQAMGAARQAGNRAAYSLHGRRLRRIEKAMQRVLEASKGKMDRLQKYDDSWLPRAYTGRTHTPEKYNKWLQLGQGGRVVRSLVPGGLRLDKYWFTPMGQVHSLAREPMRFFRNYHPQTWDMIHGSYLDYNQGTDAWNQKVYEILKAADVIKDRGKFDPRKHWMPYDVNTERRDLLFDLLDTDPNRTPNLQWELALDPEFDHLAYMAKGDAKLLEAHTKIRKLLDHAADLQGLSESPRYLSHYMRHMITSDQFANGFRPLEYIGLPVSGEVFVSHLLSRTGNKPYSKDLLMALDFYGRAMNRKIHLEPMFDHVSRRVGKELSTKFGNTALQSYCSDLVLELKGRPSFLGTKIDNAIGSPINQTMRTAQKIPVVKNIPGIKNFAGYKAGHAERIVMGINNLAYAGMIVGNPRYAVMQMATGATTTASRLGLFRTLRGVLEFATPEGQEINRAIGSYKPFIDIFEDPTWKRLVQGLTEKGVAVTPLGIMSNAKAEEVIRGISAFAAVDLMLNRLGFSTWDEAVEAGMSRLVAFRALQISQETNHLYGPLGRTPYISRMIGRSNAAFMTQFLSFTWKQTDELLSQFADDPSRIMQYLAVSGYVSRMAALTGGMDLTDYVGFGYLPKSTEDMTSPGVDGFMSLVDLSEALGGRDPETVHKAAKKVTQTLVGYVPLSQAIQSAMKSAERIQSGYLKSASGELIRPLDFATNLSKQEGQNWLATVAGSIRPEGRPNEALGGELIATAFGQRNIQEALTRRANEAIRHETRAFQFRRVQLLGEYAQALEDGDANRMDELNKALVDIYKVRLKSPEPLQRAIEARALLQRFKLMDPKWGGDELLFDRYIDIINTYGVGMED